MIIMLCLFGTAALAHDGMPTNMGSETALGASAAFDSHGKLWMVDAVNEHIRVRTSTDNGATPGGPIIVNAKPERIYSEGENRPKIAFGRQGQV